MNCKSCSGSSSPLWVALLFALTLVSLTQLPWTSKTAAATVTPPISLQTLDGKSADLNKLIAGKPTLLIFWATWCPTCRAEVPDFAGAFQRYSAKGLQVLAVDVGYDDPIEDVRQFAKARALPYTVLYDARQEAVKTYGIQGTPSVLLLDASGKVVHRGYGVDESAIRALLADKRPTNATEGNEK